MDRDGTGRVRLKNFYGTGLEKYWRFGESERYLRELGVLDESSPRRGKQVMIPNYLQVASNCIVTTPQYSVCCKNECEQLLGDIELAIDAALNRFNAAIELHQRLDDCNGTGVATGTMSSMRDRMARSVRSQLCEDECNGNGVATGTTYVMRGDFCGTGLEKDWRFGESEQYFRELGVLDESSPWRGKQVMILGTAFQCVYVTTIACSLTLLAHLLPYPFEFASSSMKRNAKRCRAYVAKCFIGAVDYYNASRASVQIERQKKSSSYS